MKNCKTGEVPVKEVKDVAFTKGVLESPRSVVTGPGQSMPEQYLRREVALTSILTLSHRSNLEPVGQIEPSFSISGLRPRSCLFSHPRVHI